MCADKRSVSFINIQCSRWKTRFKLWNIILRYRRHANKTRKTNKKNKPDIVTTSQLFERFECTTHERNKHSCVRLKRGKRKCHIILLDGCFEIMRAAVIENQQPSVTAASVSRADVKRDALPAGMNVDKSRSV